MYRVGRGLVNFFQSGKTRKDVPELKVLEKKIIVNITRNCNGNAGLMETLLGILTGNDL